MAWQNRVSFYKIPFSRTGVTYPLPTIGGIYADLESYKIGEIITEKPFNENQTRITTPAMTDALLACNYIRVGRVNPDAETPAGANDTNVSYFWCLDCYRLGTSNGEDGNTPGVFEIEPDDVMTEFFEGSAAEVAGRAVNGVLKQSTIADLQNNHFIRSFPLKKYYQDATDVDDIKTLITGLVTPTDRYTLIFSVTDAYGNILLFCSPALSADTMLSEIRNCSTITQLQDKRYTDTWVNCSVTGIWLLPYDLTAFGRLTPIYSGDITEMKTANASGKTGTFDAYEFIDADITVNYPITFTSTKNINIGDDLYIATPKNFYKYTGDMENIHAIYFSLSIVRSGLMSDSPTMQIFMNGQAIDVTDDYIMDFAVNEDALNKSRYRTSYVLKGLTTVLSAAGGVIGGIKSGNYFGAVQSIGGGVEGITDLLSAGRNPAQNISEEGRLNYFFKIKGLGYIVFKLRQNDYTRYLEKFGYTFENSPYVEISADILTEDYYQFASCEVPEIAGGGQNAQATIEAMFLRGVRFKAL